MILDIGIIGRTTVNYSGGTKGFAYGPGINTDAPYSYKKGVNGTGLNTSIGYRLSKKLGIDIQTGATIRYDFYYWEYPNGTDGKPKNTFYIDINGLISKSISKRFYGGIGFTMYNLGKELNYSNNSGNKTLELEFNSIDFLIGAKVKKIFLEPKLSVVQSNFPGTIKTNATLIGIRIYYRFFYN
jgi:hypothetical protein